MEIELLQMKSGKMRYGGRGNPIWLVAFRGANGDTETHRQGEDGGHRDVATNQGATGSWERCTLITDF